MDNLGCSKMTKTSEVVSSLREEITERASLMLAMNAPKTAFGIVVVLDYPSEMGVRHATSAAREVPGRTDLVKKEQVEATDSNDGIFILPSNTAANYDQEFRD